MADGQADAPSPPPENGGEFLLSLLHKRPYHQERHGPLTTQSPFDASDHQPVALDPAVAAVGPTVSAFPLPGWPSPGTHASPWPHTLSSPNIPASLLGFAPFPLNPSPANQLGSNQRISREDSHRLGFPATANHDIGALTQQPQQQHQHQLPPPVEPQKLLFGSFSGDAIKNLNGLINGKLVYDSKFHSAKDHERHLRNPQPVISNSNTDSNFSQTQNRNFNHHGRRGGYGGRGTGGRDGDNNSFRSTPPPRFPNKQRGWDTDMGNNDGNNRRDALQQNVNRAKAAHSNLSNKVVNLSVENETLMRSSIQNGSRFKISRQQVQPADNNQHFVSASDVEESLLVLQKEARGRGGGKDRVGKFSRARRDGSGDCETGNDEIEEFGEDFVDSLLLGDEAVDKDIKDDKAKKKKRWNSRDKESRIDERGQWLLSQRLRMLKRQMACRSDIDRLNAPFLAVYESLIPLDEELVMRKQLLSLLEKLVSKEWPEAELYLYGSCANSFGFPKSDIDVCLVIEDVNLNKSEMLLKLADILQSNNLQNVQALTRARVPIVKLMDPDTGISCDICINNVLAVVNTKLLLDYAQIDVRLRQLAFIVKHWAKSRRVNETYRGTLSSYAYVLMCIHFLQQRRPPILPSLQDIEPTYSVTVDDIHCAFFDEVDKLRNFGSDNRETIAQLVWGFFNYWAYGHDYANSVISVRTGNIISKQEKEWTRRVGNDRHLICIEDPFETNHDLGRVVDKFSIRVLRGEFERAAEIMQHDPNPCVKLFEPYVRGDH